jgi:hypothetical protein
VHPRILTSPALALVAPFLIAAASPDIHSTQPTPHQQTVHVSWGHRSPVERPFRLHLSAEHVAILRVGPVGFEVNDRADAMRIESRAGDGDVDAVTIELFWETPTAALRKPQSIWQYLLEHGTPGQVTRLNDDPGLQPGAPLLTIATAVDGTTGISIGLEQLERHGAMWFPDHDLFVTVGASPVDFQTHLATLRGQRVLDRVRLEPEASLAQWRARWTDIGDPLRYNKPWETSWLGTRGHLVCTTARHGSLYKFGVDRWGSVRPDFASPHKFRLDPLWPGCTWVSQRIIDGLPVIVTTLERGTQRCVIEQFAAPLSRTEPLKRGEVETAFFTRIQITGEGPLSIGFRLATENTNRTPELRRVAGRLSVVDRETGSVWLMVEPGDGLTLKERDPIRDEKDPRIEFDFEGSLEDGDTREIILKLASPVVSRNAARELAGIDVHEARAATIAYWEDWLAQGAQFESPEPEVNDLFRANLWHALMLPRHRTDEQGVDRIDLPYSNFAYGQLNADWPINQAVYVNYMIHGLRGHFGVAEEEFAAMFQTQQRANGRIGGYAEWGVYSPGMLYSIAQNYLLSRDRESFERLLPSSLRALDWCLQEVAQGQDSTEAPGLIVAPLNDLTHDARAWAFPNAYFVAGLELFGRALAAHGHPRAGETLAVARQMKRDVERAFARASVRSPAIQLADGTWANYVPCDAMTPRRLLDQWYPTDVDTGALHLSRLGAIDPGGWLTTALLHDHEDNLFLNQWGMANEPIYNQQATAFLLRDEPEAAIRAFYSMMACAFSHEQYSPLEHRWAWGQYYGPPSTDGAWFELYRNMLINELQGEGILLIGQAIPRGWLEDGKQIRVEGAPTYYGPVTMTLESRAKTGSIHAGIALSDPNRPDVLQIRFRHPHRALLRAVTVNGLEHRGFDRARETIMIQSPDLPRYKVVGYY